MTIKLPLRREFFPAPAYSSSASGHTIPAAELRREIRACGPLYHGGLFMNQPNNKEYKQRQKQNKEPTAQNKAKSEPQNGKDEPQAR